MADDVPCPLCDDTYDPDLDPCLHWALARIASLEAELNEMRSFLEKLTDLYEGSTATSHVNKFLQRYRFPAKIKETR